MRKLTLGLLSSVFLAAVLFLTSCKKEWSGSAKTTTVSEVVEAFLDKQKSPEQPNKAGNIDLLKDNLDYSGIRYEPYVEGDQLMIIPIKEDYKIKKNVDKNTILNLVLINDKSGFIKNARIAIYIPEAGKSVGKIPVNTFSNVLTLKPTGINGMFRFLSVSGRWLHQYEYKNGAFYSYGQVQEKKNTNTASRMEMVCIEWYLVTTYYIDGVQVAQTEQYLGTTCTCDDPTIMGLCPEQGGGGGGGGGGDPTLQEDQTETVEKPDGTDDGATGGTGGPNDPNSPVGVLEPGDQGGSYGRAPAIRYQYVSHVVRTGGIVTTAIAYPTTIANNHAVYIDRYGRPTTRSLVVFGTFQTATVGAPFSACFWSCVVWGNWVYADGVSSPYSRTWSDTHTSLR